MDLNSVLRRRSLWVGAVFTPLLVIWVVFAVQQHEWFGGIGGILVLLFYAPVGILHIVSRLIGTTGIINPIFIIVLHIIFWPFLLVLLALLQKLGLKALKIIAVVMLLLILSTTTGCVAAITGGLA